MIVKNLNQMMFMNTAKGTAKENELFDYADIPSYYKIRKKSNNYEKDKDDYEMSL